MELSWAYPQVHGLGRGFHLWLHLRQALLTTDLVDCLPPLLFKTTGGSIILQLRYVPFLLKEDLAQLLDDLIAVVRRHTLDHVRNLEGVEQAVSPGEFDHGDFVHSEFA